MAWLLRLRISLPVTWYKKEFDPSIDIKIVFTAYILDEF